VSAARHVTDYRPVRVAALRDLLATEDLDALLVSHVPNVRWLTGFSGTSALAVVTALDVVLLTDFRYATQVEEEVGGAARTIIVEQSLWTGLWELLATMPAAQRVGFDSAHLVHRDFQRLLEQGNRWQWRPTTDLIEGLRERKDVSEVAAIRRAIGIAEGALASALESLAPGLTETQVAGLLEKALRDAGSEEYPFPSIVASGERSALPHARAGERRLAAGDFVLFDFGAVADGYCSDITRTVVLGSATVEQREVYEVVREANERAAGSVRAGMKGMDADAVAREYIHARGFGEAFGHSLGHGIGLEVHEAPRLAKSAEALLPVGAVVTIEPGIYRPGWGGVRIEDNVLLMEQGSVVLTAFRRDLLEIS